MFSTVANRFKYRQNALFRDIVFKKFSAVAIRFKHCQNACLKDIIFQNFLCCCKSFQIPSEALFRDIVFKMFSAVSNTFKMHALETLPLVAIHHVLLIWSFGNCVLLLDHCFKQARTWWCSVTHSGNYVYALFMKVRSLWSGVYSLSKYTTWLDKNNIIKTWKT